jgi:anhydro-N-acetylmuramic acid kinase
VKYKVIGLMSGTSLDGLDLAYCEFSHENNKWVYTIRCAETIAYSGSWRERLANVESGSALDLVTTDVEYGHLIGRLTHEFIGRHHLQPDFIASHGHTVFHQPAKKITCQIGRGAAIAAETGLAVVCDFRSTDVALGGQGAPLVPAGDKLLFGNFEFCLNIGGFANISYEQDSKRIAFDTCPANIVLNHLAAREGHDFDPGGTMARKGCIDKELLSKLNTLPYYNLPPPKSLGKEWVTEHVFPLLAVPERSTNDLLATFCEHIAIQIAASAVAGDRGSKLLLTGGGAWNEFLTERIRAHAAPEIIIPDANTVNYKEALIFAFLGTLRWRNEANCLMSVTGAARDSSGGAIY